MKKVFTVEDVNRLNELNNSVKGTSDYHIYYIYSQSNWKNEDGKWVGWKAGSWTNGIYSNRPLTVKRVKDKVYLVTEEYNVNGYVQKDRYELTSRVREIFGL